MRTKVEVLFDDQQYKDYKKGQIGYIDGYVRGGNGAPFCMVVIGEKIVMMQAHNLRVINGHEFLK